ncbi:MAG: hypothetical protein ACI89J_001294 [Hyphomicrobiaceae bacterium]|jgi:hypothetical protein
MPPQISHSWIEVEIDGRWRRIDSVINDLALFEAARAELKRRRQSIGFSVAMKDGEASADLNLDDEVFQQMAAVTLQSWSWEDPSDYYGSGRCRNRPDALRLWFYRRMLGAINRRVEQLRRDASVQEASATIARQEAQSGRIPTAVRGFNLLYRHCRALRVGVSVERCACFSRKLLQSAFPIEVLPRAQTRPC